MQTTALITSAQNALANRGRGGRFFETEARTSLRRLRERVTELEGRLARADDVYPHEKDDPIPEEHERLYLTILAEYETAYDALTAMEAEGETKETST